MIHFRHSWCHRIRKSCLFPGKRIKYFFGRQVGRQVLNNCVRAHKEAEESGRYGGSKGIFEVSHPPASSPPPPPVSIGILSKWNQHNLSCSLIFHTEWKFLRLELDICRFGNGRLQIYQWNMFLCLVFVDFLIVCLVFLLMFVDFLLISCWLEMRCGARAICRSGGGRIRLRPPCQLIRHQRLIHAKQNTSRIQIQIQTPCQLIPHQC